MKSTDRILAKRYAKAYDALSTSSEQAAGACEALAAAAQALVTARGYMKDPAVPTAEKIAFVQSAFAKEQTVASFLAVLLTAKRYDLLDSCVQEVQALLDVRQGIVRARVQTAFELSGEAKKQVEETLSRFTGKKAVAQFETQPSLLGGVRMQLEDTLIDGSLKGRFEKLQQELTK